MMYDSFIYDTHFLGTYSFSESRCDTLGSYQEFKVKLILKALKNLFHTAPDRQFKLKLFCFVLFYFVVVVVEGPG